MKTTATNPSKIKWSREASGFYESKCGTFRIIGYRAEDGETYTVWNLFVNGHFDNSYDTLSDAKADAQVLADRWFEEALDEAHREKAQSANTIKLDGGLRWEDRNESTLDNERQQLLDQLNDLRRSLDWIADSITENEGAWSAERITAHVRNTIDAKAQVFALEGTTAVVLDAESIKEVRDGLSARAVNVRQFKNDKLADSIESLNETFAAALNRISN